MSSPYSRSHSTRGSALVIALLFAGVLIAMGAASFMVINNKYTVVHQAASWQEALLTADAGVDMALTEIRKQLWDPAHAWETWTVATPTETTATEALTAGGNSVRRTSDIIVREKGEGSTTSYAIVTVDAPPELRDSTMEQWYRIRSTGVCELPGARSIRGNSPGGEKSDVHLRKFDFKFDHFDPAHPTVEAPRATRRIEAIAKPQSAFRTALMGVVTIDMTDHNIVVDSYDSRDSSKSTNGFYDPAKRQLHGDIATNGTVINAGSAHIYGTASTNGGTVLNSDNVTGNFPNDPNAIRNDFFQEVVTVIPPTVTATTGTPANISGNTTITASAGSPTQVIVSGINLSGQSVLRIAGAADGSDTFAQFVVSGNLSMSGQAAIILDPGVHVRMFVRGDTDITGNGVSNPNSPLAFQFYGLDRPANADGSANVGQIKIAGNGGFRGTVYAPNYDVELKGGGNTDSIYGSFVGNTIRMTGIQSVHYDEALGDGGLVTGYNIVSWFEDER